MIKPESIEEGCLISVDIKPTVATSSYYTGITKRVNEHGIRMSPIKWDGLNGTRFSTEDIYIPWVNVKSALVCPNK